jgi:hypothetical protein
LRVAACDSRRHPDKRYILCRQYLNCPTSCANLSSQMDRPIDLTGRTFGKWVVLPRDGIESNHRHSEWLVQCECGRLRLVPGQDLLNGRSSSCGCASSPKNNREAKTSGRSVALRTRLQRVMNELRPEEQDPGVNLKVREFGVSDEDTQSDRWMIV